MTQHRQLCFDQSPLLIQMPASLQMVQFSSYNKQTRSPFVVYADLEAFDVKTESYADMIDDYGEKVLNSFNAATLHIEDQFPCSFGAILIDIRSGKAEKQKFYRGKNVIATLMQTLGEWTLWAYEDNQKFTILNLDSAKKSQLVSNWGDPC